MISFFISKWIPYSNIPTATQFDWICNALASRDSSGTWEFYLNLNNWGCKYWRSNVTHVVFSSFCLPLTFFNPLITQSQGIFMYWINWPVEKIHFSWFLCNLLTSQYKRQTCCSLLNHVMQKSWSSWRGQQKYWVSWVFTQPGPNQPTELTKCSDAT